MPADRCLALAAALLLGVSGGGESRAAQIDFVSVTHRGNGFEIVFDAVVDAPAQRAYAVLTDYAHLGKLNPVITAISVSAAPSGRGKRVRSVIQACVWFFCRNLVQIEDVSEPDGHTIVAHMVPGAGDFESGSRFWRVTAEGSRTRLHYEATRVAAFWLPPLVGTWAIERALRRQLESSIAVLERLAQQEPP